MKVGSEAIQPPKTLELMLVAKPAVTRMGAVSPMTLAIARVTPDAMPEIAVGITTLMMVRHLRTPSAYAASRSSLGTILSISSLDRTTTGIISTESATAATAPVLVPGPTTAKKKAAAKRPATMDGMPVITSTKKVMARAS